MVSCVIVDDDHNIVNVFCEMLDMIGLDVIDTGNNGLDAVNMYKKHHPDIVFTDLQMPDYDGFYAIEEIKDIDLDANIVAVTGDLKASESFLLESLNVPVVNKPFYIHSIKQVIADIFLTKETLGEIAPFKIRYKFREDDKYYSCIITYEQYRNFKKLPIIQECEIINNRQKKIESQYQEIQKALDMAVRNDTSHIRRLSETM